MRQRKKSDPLTPNRKKEIEMTDKIDLGNQNPRRGMPDKIKVIEVIEITCLAGTGTTQDPGRLILQYWTLDGRLLAISDKLKEV